MKPLTILILSIAWMCFCIGCAAFSNSVRQWSALNMRTKKRITLAGIRDELKTESGLPAGYTDDVGRMAIGKMLESTEWMHQEFNEEEIKNAILAYLKEHGKQTPNTYLG